MIQTYQSQFLTVYLDGEQVSNMKSIQLLSLNCTEQTILCLRAVHRFGCNRLIQQCNNKDKRRKSIGHHSFLLSGGLPGYAERVKHVTSMTAFAMFQ